MYIGNHAEQTEVLVVLTDQERDELGRRRRAIRTLLPGSPSQEELAERAGVSPKAVQAAEAGRSVDEDKLRALAHACGMEFGGYAEGVLPVHAPAPDPAPVASDAS